MSADELVSDEQWVRDLHQSGSGSAAYGSGDEPDEVNGIGEVDVAALMADDDEPRRAKKTHATAPTADEHPVTAAKEKEKLAEKPVEKEKEPAPKPSSTSSSSGTTAKGGGGGGLKGLGRKIKGLF